VARRQSFKLAADDLHVTQSALSHHVRHLESDLGVDLLVRLHRRIRLTDAGHQLLEGCGAHFDGLALAVDRLYKAGDTAALTVSVAPYFSSRWLTPRVGRLWSRHPGLNVQLRHAYEPADFLHDSVDAGISWGHGHWPGVESVLLLAGNLTAVCGAALRSQLPSTVRAKDLLKHRLLYEFEESHWQAWFQAAGVSGRFSAIRIDDSHALRRAVLDGHGIGLFFDGLIHEDVASGQLVKLLPLSIDCGNSYYLVHPRGKPVRPQLADFKAWVLDEARREPYA
jgi:DNA-binding transcriptional LysR family regulator